MSQIQAAWLRGAEFLLTNQDAAGGWRRSRYGALRGGAAITAMILYALRYGPEEFRLAAKKPLAAAADFLRHGLQRRGLIAAPDGTLDLPVYAASLALLAEDDNDLIWSTEHRASLLEYLLNAQIMEARGFASDHPQIGGWDVGTSPLPRGITTGVNVSLTRWALEAITATASRMGKMAEQATMSQRVREAQSKAIGWLRRCQNLPGDGGFPFTAEARSSDNKAGFDEATGRGFSYATTTCDGLRGLQAAGVAPDAPARQTALAWLEARSEQFARVPGHATAPRQSPDAKAALSGGWTDGLWYYFASQVAGLIGEFKDRDRSQAARELLVRELISRQRADGSWSNASSYMREDDPLIATPLALLALHRLDS
ncbi:MAG: hypothetical protein U1A77_25485 [Pirellulales bacterium]